jgi:alpha-mannosidase
VGYKAYSLKEIPDAAPAPPEVSTTTMENQFYRVELDPESGAVKSIFDKELNKELVNTTSPYRFDQYLYVTGGDESPNRLLEYSANWPIPDLTIHNASGGRLVSITNEPFGMTARLESSGVNTPKIETEVILFSGQKKIEFINHVRKTEVYTKEGVYFAFPLAMNRPEFRYEIQNGFVNPAHDQLPGAEKSGSPCSIGWRRIKTALRRRSSRWTPHWLLWVTSCGARGRENLAIAMARFFPRS